MFQFLNVRPIMIFALRGRISVTRSFPKTFACWGFALALLAPMYVEAEEEIDAQQTYSPSEIYLLPPYCKYTPIFRDRVPGGSNAAEIERWTNKMGGESVFRHMHHYCRGLMSTNRGAFISRTRQDRDHNFAVSISEYEYVIQRMPPNMYLLPEIHTKKGETLARLNR